MDIRKTYKYRLYRNDKKDRKLRHKIFVASTIWNHFIALQRRYYRLTDKYISLHEMNRHVLKLRKRARFALWRDLHSQACQDVCRRVDEAYQRFFNKLARGRPKFRKATKYSSFTFPQSGHKVEGNTVTIDGTTCKFVKHREMNGQIKPLTIKRDAVGRLYFEDLNLQGMKAMWGRKVSDLGFGSFLNILEWVAFKRGKSVVKLDRFAPTTKVCSGCGQKHNLTLRDRVLHCACGLVIDRDHNAAINIKTAGASAVYRSASKTRVHLRRRVEGRSPRL